MSGETSEKTQMPVAEGLFVLPLSPSEKPCLIGNKCRSCGEVFFPSRTCCRNCSSYDMEEVTFPRTGKLFSFTTVRVHPPHCLLEVPYIAGIVELEGGERIRTLLADCGQNSLEIGQEMELVIESLGKAKEAMGRIAVSDEILAYKFRPVRGEQ